MSSQPERVSGTVATDGARLVSRDTAEHYVWGQSCDAWYLHQGVALHVIEERMPPGTAEVLHWHGRSTQIFYALRGTLTMRTSAGEDAVRAGRAAVVNAGVSHQARNDSGEVVEFIVISCPPTHDDRIDVE